MPPWPSTALRRSPVARRFSATARSSARRSAGYGYTVGKTIALAYLPADVAKDANFKSTPTETLCSFPGANLYDPSGARLKGEGGR